MIALLGDIHGFHYQLVKRAEEAHHEGADLLIQVGDFGVYPGILEGFRRLALPLPVWFLDGNHEDHLLINATKWPTKNGIDYVGRSAVREAGPYLVAMLGGGGSIDKDYRLRRGIHWSPQEVITHGDVSNLIEKVAGRRVNFFITHCPPQSFIIKHFEQDPMRKVHQFGVAPDWKDPSADMVEQAWSALGHPELICGHMHMKIDDREMKIRCLDVGELMFI